MTKICLFCIEYFNIYFYNERVIRYFLKQIKNDYISHKRV